MEAVNDLAAFIAACYDEAEALAKAAGGKEWDASRETLHEHGGPFGREIGTLWSTPDDRDEHPNWHAARHIAANSPARRLADIALKRAILAEHQPIETIFYGTCCAGCVSWRDAPLAELGIAFPSTWPCVTVRQLGAEFSNQPGYKPEWKPS